MTRIPTPIKHAIERRLGAPTRHHTGTFHPTRCQCGTWTLHGLHTLLIHLDPTPLTTALEQAAWLLGRATYQLHHTPGHFQVTPRGHPGTGLISHLHPPPGPECVVIPEHKCGRPYLAKTIPITKPKPKPIPDNTETPF